MSHGTAVANPSQPGPQTTPQGRSEDRPGIFDGLVRDLRYAARVLYHQPAFTLVALLTLALGIGANTAIFSVVNAALITPVPIPSPDRVVMVWTDKEAHGSSGYPASVLDFIDWQSSGVFQNLTGFVIDGYNVLVGHTPLRIIGAAVTDQWFEIADIHPVLGRVFHSPDMQPGHNQVAVLTYDFWNGRLGADPESVGKPIFVNNQPFTIIGVLPKSIAKVANEEIYVPLLLPVSSDRGMRYISTMGRLTPGVSLSAAQSRMDALSRRLAAQYTLEDGGNRARLQPVEQAYVEDIHTLVIVLSAAVGFVLLVACANIANLLLVRGAARRRELAIRSALGAGKFLLLRQLLTESVLLSVLGGLLGLIPALVGIRFLAKYRPDTLPNADLLRLNPTVLLFTLALAVFTGLIFGIIPAWNAWRTNAVSPLRERSQTSGELRFGNLFVIGEVALTVILTVAAGLMLRSFIHLRSTYPGYDTKALTMRVSLTGKQYDSPGEQTKFCRLLLARLDALAGVRVAAAVDAIPTSGDLQGGTLHFTDRPDEGQNNAAVVVIAPVTPDFFQAMRIPVLSGRPLRQSDGSTSQPVVLVDRELAKKYWPNQDPIGKMVSVRAGTPFRKIVGTVGRIERNIPLQVKAQIGQVYVPFDQWPSSDISLVISSNVDALGLIGPVRREISALAPDQPVYDIQTLDEARATRQTSARFGTWLLGFFAVLSLSLAAIGVYGVVAYTVAQRTREFGLRMALGATQQDLVLGVLKKGFTLVLIGLAVGFCAALAVGSLMHDLLNGVSSTDPVAFLGAAFVLLLAGLLATFIPAYRASRIDPMVALRYE